MECKILCISLVVGLLFAVGAAAYSYVYSHGVQRDIANNVIRFHVRANSGSPADQALKYHVRNEILVQFNEFFMESDCINETRSQLLPKLDLLNSHAEYVVQSAGFSYAVTANFSRLFFPTQFYGNIALPPGEYEAVQIIIGEGAGSNWWCLMFPPLCYVDMTSTECGRQQLANTVSDEGFRLLMHQEEPSRSLTVRFRIVEWWQNRGQPAEPQPIQNIAGKSTP
ncbi:MAG: stage II sporulation protein R [Firmicutes bacterium]|nr:stage II sporulation protein R [Bacillota bacterium]